MRVPNAAHLCQYLILSFFYNGHSDVWNSISLWYSWSFFLMANEYVCDLNWMMNVCVSSVTTQQITHLGIVCDFLNTRQPNTKVYFKNTCSGAHFSSTYTKTGTKIHVLNQVRNCYILFRKWNHYQHKGRDESSGLEDSPGQDSIPSNVLCPMVAKSSNSSEPMLLHLKYNKHNTS